MNINVLMYYLVVFLEWLIAVLPWAFGLCGLLLVIYFWLIISEIRENKRGKYR